MKLKIHKLCVLTSVLVMSYSFATQKLQYSPIGNYYIGSTLYLPFPNKDLPAKTTNIYSVKLSNGKNFDLTYPMLSYLPGVIINPNTHLFAFKERERTAFLYMVRNFKEYFDMLSGNYTADDGTVYYVPDWLPEINQIVKQEYEDNSYNIAHNLPIVEDLDQKFNCLTGGACSDDILDSLQHPGLSLKIAYRNGEHFGDGAIENYLLGHYVALIYALLATDVNGLKLAYSYEAFAANYLEDAFAAGNQMTDIKNIFAYENSPEMNKIYSDVHMYPITKRISKYMFVSLLARLERNYFNRTGIVFKRSIDLTSPWMSYGNDSALISQNATNIDKLRDTLQKGILQIYHAYKHDYRTDTLFSYIDIMWNYTPDTYDTIELDNKPLFVFSNNRIYDISDGMYNPDGSTPMLCILKSHLDDVFAAETIPAKTKTVIKQLLLDECPKDYMDGIATTTVEVSSSKHNISTVNSHVHVNSTTPTFFDYPVLSFNGVTCQFTLPVKFYNYGLLNSLDIADFSGVKNLQYVNTISSNYLTCKGFTATYTNSTDRNKRMFTLLKSNLPSNVKVCEDGNGVKFLANKSFNCWFK